jgi:tetratricopeptide (TPR) repeat protein
MRFRMPSFRTLVIVVIAVPAAWLVIWFLIAWASHAAGVALPSSGDLVGLLAGIGGLMGAVFTVGGLVIALVAVLTQLQLEDRAKRVMEDKFNELAPQLEEKAIRLVNGRIAFRDAQDALQRGEWQQAAELAREALQLYPTLPGVRSTVGLSMSRAVEVGFRAELRQIVDATEYLHEEMDRLSGQWSYPPRDVLPPPKSLAIQWLNDAHRSEDDPQGQVSSALALLYGHDRAHDQMIEALNQAVIANPEQKMSCRRRCIWLCLSMLVQMIARKLRRSERSWVILCPCPSMWCATT